MKKQKKICTIIILLVFMLAILVNFEVFASNTSSPGKEVQYSEKYQKWLTLSEEEKQNVIKPRMYDVPYTKIKYKNPLLRANMLRATIDEPFTLQSVIPNNLVIKDQQQTSSCWTFAALSSLETNLALANKDKSKVYDFSERHMEYATSRVFENNEINLLGYNRTVGSGGAWDFAVSYLTTGVGAINESDMPFENNEDTININAIQGKKVRSQVYDTIEFPDYNDYSLNETQKNDIKNQIKNHIQNYGSVFGCVKAGSFAGLISPVSNNTGALALWGGFADHAVSIVGWDDSYAVSNWDEFDDNEKPTNPGAWIVRNSWGTEQGKDGYIYVSYEDDNISNSLSGIIKATDSVEYDNLYQYDQYYPNYKYYSFEEKVMFANVFTKSSSKTEYLTQVALHIPRAGTYKVYVNPNGSEKTKEALKPVLLKSGETETFNNTGYHTLEFAKPIEISSDQFTVAIEIYSEDGRNAISCVEIENIEESSYYSVVKIETGKCFLLDNYEWKYINDDGIHVYDYDWDDWEDMATLKNHPCHTALKVFTTNELIDESLKNIEITTPPTKTEYWAGDDFDKAGMVVKANYNSKAKPFVVLDNSSYSITNGTNLKAGQTSVTITYEDKTVEQPIQVKENKVEELKITTPPTKTEYWAGDDFDKTGMVVKTTYTDETTVEVTDYEITNGSSLENGQTSITVLYGDKTAEQSITVKANPVVKLEITQAPNKTDYVVGQNFNITGMIVKATYTNGTIKEITDYEVKDGNSLSEGQTTVTISYEQQTATQAIAVVAKAITEINVKTKPTKTKYIQNKDELDLTGGVIEIKYNDTTTERIEMTSDEVSAIGFDNSNLGKITITITYLSNTAQYEVEIIEEEKAENSKMHNAVVNVKTVKAYYFTDESQKDYTLIDVEINGIEKALNNDKMEYYYFLSSNKNEENITDWVKINVNQVENNNIKFTIDTTKIANYNEISNSEVVYLFIKEVATKGGNQIVAISQPMKIESNVKIEIYLDNVKKENITSGSNATNNSDSSKDDTISDIKIPNAGTKTFVIISVIILVAIICVFCYKKYNWFRDIK